MTSFAYLFERFPSFTQTFCYREVGEMRRIGTSPALYSIRRPDDIPVDCPSEIAQAVQYFPEEGPGRILKDAQAKGCLGSREKKIMDEWRYRPDKNRIYEALWLGPRLQKEGIHHVHVHFAGIAARTAYWLKQFFGIAFSFTGHANDVFCETDFPVQLADLIREASFVVTETRFSQEWLQEQHPEWAAKIHRVYNGIDLSLFPGTAAPASGSPRIVSVGRCIEKKGFADLIDACALLRERGVDFECSIVGGGPLEESLRARVAERGLEKAVKLTGPLPQEKVREMLVGSQLFVLACATEADGGMDNFPTVIVEAMASARPVVSTRMAGVPELVEHGTTGLLVAERDPAGLAGAMATLLGDPERARQLGARGRERVTEQFTTAISALELRNLLAGCKTAKIPKLPGTRARLMEWFSETGNAVLGRVRPKTTRS